MQYSRRRTATQPCWACWRGSNLASQNRRLTRPRSFINTFLTGNTIDGVILYKNRIIIPPSHTVLYTQPIKKYWCNDCNRIAPSQPNPPPTPMALYPFQCIAADYFHHAGNSYLVAVDRFFNWPIIEKAKDRSKCLINVTYGIPDELFTDGGSRIYRERHWPVSDQLESPPSTLLCSLPTL